MTGRKEAKKEPGHRTRSVADDTTEVGVRVVDALEGKVGVWKELNFPAKLPTEYKEKK